MLENFNEYWVGGDVGIRELFFLKTIFPMIYTVTTYVLVVTVIGPALMKNKKPFEMRRLMIAYNFSLVAFYLYFLTKGVFFISALGFKIVCGPLSEESHPLIPDMFLMGYKLYIIKLIELLDTVFLVLSKKFNKISPLHVIHHAIVPIFGWFGLRSETSGYLAVFMAINSIAHVIMYTYYAIAALGPEYQKYVWWKKHLTTFQITQFFLMTFYLLIMSSIGCVTSRLTFWFCVIMTIIFFFLFIDYYKKIYSNKGKLAEKGDHANGTPKNGTPTKYFKAS